MRNDDIAGGRVPRVLEVVIVAGCGEVIPPQAIIDTELLRDLERVSEVDAEFLLAAIPLQERVDARTGKWNAQQEVRIGHTCNVSVEVKVAECRIGDGALISLHRLQFAAHFHHMAADIPGDRVRVGVHVVVVDHTAARHAKSGESRNGQCGSPLHVCEPRKIDTLESNTLNKVIRMEGRHTAVGFPSSM